MLPWPQFQKTIANVFTANPPAEEVPSGFSLQAGQLLAENGAFLHTNARQKAPVQAFFMTPHRSSLDLPNHRLVIIGQVPKLTRNLISEWKLACPRLPKEIKLWWIVSKKTSSLVKSRCMSPKIGRPTGNLLASSLENSTFPK